jgi:phosphatidate phosphatase APP1
VPTRRRIHRAAHAIDQGLDRRRPRIAGRPIVIHPYRGFGRQGEMLVKGRVLLEKTITRATEAEPLWRNLVNTYRRFQSDELAGVGVRARYRDAVGESVTDEEGHFQLLLRPGDIPSGVLWHEVTLELAAGGSAALTHVLLPPPDARMGIISDIDDTIVRTGATSLLTMIRSVIANAAARLPFDGVADLYRLLHGDRNPLFYVSSSPWNLYPLLHDFMEINRIPHGPMFLQDWGIDDDTLITAPHSDHKLAQINLLLDYYPTLPFILIGDSGQHDPEIYLQVIRARPGRIKAALIHDVTAGTRDRAVALLVDEARSAGVEMAYVRDWRSALAEAERLGLM